MSDESDLEIELELDVSAGGGGGGLARLRGALLAAPEPRRAAALASEVLRAQPPADRGALAARGAEALAALCGTAPFFARFLVRHPEWLAPLVDAQDAAVPDSAALTARLDAALASQPAEEAGRVLREFKYRELARITLRDAVPGRLPLAQSLETLDALSDLADVVLDRALKRAAARVAERHGPPEWIDAHGQALALGFCVLGLGKLGTRELNYSSDVDLVYVHEQPPAGCTTGPTELRPGDYFTRLAQEFARVVGPPTADGFLYRIDLDLRPEGGEGPLVVSDDALHQYYEAWAETWEKAAFMKARPVAGDLQLGWRAIRSIAPILYRSSIDYGGVHAIRELKEKIESARVREDAGFDVKLGAGGIRDIEFVAQALQFLHGGRIPQLRERSTAGSIGQLGSLGLLPRADADALLDAYRFLRRLENRLQMEAERQTHVLPPDPAHRLRIARAMDEAPDAESGARFEASLEQHREATRRVFASLLADEDSGQILSLFERSAPSLVAFPESIRMVEGLAASFARELDRCSDPERALNNLARFIQGVGQRGFYYELLLDRPELVARLVALFDASNYLSSILALHPQLIEPVFADPDALLLSPEELRDDLAGIERDLAERRPGDPEELTLDALRLFYNRQVVNVGLLDLAEKVSADQVEGALSDLAEACLERALAFAREHLADRGDLREMLERTALLVVGMGKLASRELRYGSDLDLIFLFDVGDGDPADRVAATEPAIKLAQRMIGALQTRTAEGACYEIDARLRPSGNQGALVTSLVGFEQYHEKSAQGWERQILLRARPVAGDPALADRFETLRRRILQRPLPGDLREESHRIRMRMEEELARETAARRDFKTGRGGVLDVESVVQYLQLRGGAQHPELLEPERTEVQLARLQSLGLIDESDNSVLREGWLFLQRLSSRLRIVENRSISDLDEERGDLDGLARRLGYHVAGREAAARRALLADYRRHTEAIRSVYAKVFGS